VPFHSSGTPTERTLIYNFCHSAYATSPKERHEPPVTALGQLRFYVSMAATFDGELIPKRLRVSAIPSSPFFSCTGLAEAWRSFPSLSVEFDIPLVWISASSASMEIGLTVHGRELL